MVVPGLYSLFTALELSFSADRSISSDTLQFAVTAVERRFRVVRLWVCGGGLHGSLETLTPYPPVVQPAMARVMTLVEKTEFKGSTALIVGGSRGLGELTSKVVAAGGGHVTITYASGKTDAESVADEIRASGAECETAVYDVRESALEQLGSVSRRIPTHIYYFATPPIATRRSDFFDSRRFAEFNTFYLSGFLELVRACVERGAAGLRVFYPSTVFVQARPAGVTEYAMSKAAAEVLCDDLREYLSGVTIITRRLPPLLTDQTNSVLQIETADPLDVILGVVREMHL